MKRVFYSAFVRVNDDSHLPALPGGTPLLREHHVSIRQTGFYDIMGLRQRNYYLRISRILMYFWIAKCGWALRHLDLFPVEIMRADYQELLRVPGIGYKSAQRIVRARRQGSLDYEALKKMGVSLGESVSTLLPARGSRCTRRNWRKTTSCEIFWTEGRGCGRTFHRTSCISSCHYLMIRVFQCEESLTGILTGVYDAWGSRLGHANVRLIAGIENPQLFCEYEDVSPDVEKAGKVMRTIKNRMGKMRFV